MFFLHFHTFSVCLSPGSHQPRAPNHFQFSTARCKTTFAQILDTTKQWNQEREVPVVDSRDKRMLGRSQGGRASQGKSEIYKESPAWWEAQGFSSSQGSFPRGQPVCLDRSASTLRGGRKEEEETTVYSYLENIFSLVFLTCELPAQNTPNTFLTPSNQINKWEERLLKTLTSSLSRKAVFHTRNLLSEP